MVSTSNIVITNNVISSGLYGAPIPIFGGYTPTNSFYDSSAWIYGSAIIEGNIFSSVNTANDMVKITDGNCLIQGNKFNRNGVAINAYIGNYTSANDYGTDISLGNHVIVNNTFDSTTNGTFDGYESKLCKGLVPTTIYTKNKNQSGVTAIPLFNDSWGIVGPSFSSSKSLTTVYGNSIAGLDISSASDGSNMIQIRRATDVTSVSNNYKLNLITRFDGGSGHTFRIRRSFMFRDYVTEGASFTYAKIGAYCPTGNVVDFTNAYFKVMVVAHNPSFNMDATKLWDNTSFSGGGSYLLVEYKKTIDSTTFADMQTTTVYNDLTGFGFGGFTPGNYFGLKYPDLLSSTNGYLIELIFEARITFDGTSSDPYTIFFTPIEVGYNW